jgi:hypothetical protein
MLLARQLAICTLMMAAASPSLRGSTCTGGKNCSSKRIKQVDNTAPVADCWSGWPYKALTAVHASGCFSCYLTCHCRLYSS